jgi:hypothetical protein
MRKWQGNFARSRCWWQFDTITNNLHNKHTKSHRSSLVWEVSFEQKKPCQSLPVYKNIFNIWSVTRRECSCPQISVPGNVHYSHHTIFTAGKHIVIHLMSKFFPSFCQIELPALNILLLPKKLNFVSFCKEQMTAKMEDAFSWHPLCKQDG